MGINYALVTDGPQPKQWHLSCLRHLEQVGHAQLRCVLQVLDLDQSPALSQASWRRQLVHGGTSAFAELRRVSGQLDTDSLTFVERKIVSDQLDFILFLGSPDVGYPFINSLRLGVWYFIWSDVQRFVSRVPYFWETYFDYDASGACLLRLGDRSQIGTILKSGHFPTFRGTHEKAVDVILDAAAKWPALVCRELQAGVADYFDAPTSPPPASKYGYPTPLQVLRFKTTLAKRKVLKGLRANMARLYWNVGIAAVEASQIHKGDHNVDVSVLQPYEREAYFADPCVFEHNHRVYVFCEKFSYKTNLGTLVVFEIENGQASAPTTVIAEPFHLSYPQIFKYQGEIYCMPESAALKKVLLYKAVDFPTNWEMTHVLIDDFAAHDSTLVRHDDRWWLFCTSGDEGYNSHLYAWHASDLMGPWRPHAKNPVKIDVRSAGPAGQLIMHNGVLYRPAQDCSRRYGGNIVINRIDRLSSTQFKESVVASLRPNATAAYKYGLHTMSALGDRYVVDVLKYVFVPSGIINVARTLLSHAVRGVGVPEASIQKIKKTLGLRS